MTSAAHTTHMLDTTPRVDVSARGHATNSAAKSLLKGALEIAALIAAAPAVICYKATALATGPTRAFPGWSQLVSLVPGMTGAYFRRAFYRMVLPTCGDGACICFGTVMSHPTVEIGPNSYVGVACMLGDVTLERDVLIGSHVSVINGSRQHGTERLDVPVRDQPGEYPRITIGADSWIGDRAVVMANIGRQCIVGAGAVVTKPVPDFAIAAGNPARIINWRHVPASESDAPTEPFGGGEQG